MKAARLGTLCGFALLVNVQAQGQTARSDADTLRSSVMELLSLTTFGMIAVADQAAAVSQNGPDFHITLPLSGFSSPANAAVEATARPMGGGIWNITTMTLPPSGTVEPAVGSSGGSRIDYTIDQQTIHAQVDPQFVQPSSFAAKFTGVSLRTGQGKRDSEQMFDQYSVDGAVSGETAGRVTFGSASKGVNWHMTSRGPDHSAADTLVRAVAGRLTIEDLDRVQGDRLVTAGRALLAMSRQAVPSAAPDQPDNSTIARLPGLRAVIDAMPGLLSRFEADQTLDGISFTIGSAASGTISQVHVNMAGSVANERLATHMDIAMDDLDLSGKSDGMAGFVPRHVDLKSAAAGIRVSKLMALLRAATEPDVDPSALQGQLAELLDEPDARLGIDHLAFDAGPLRMAGSARTVPRPGGQVSAAVHLSATGLDALIAQVQATPGLQQALPGLFMAKGMGRADGDAIVWDISLGDGPMTINGTPFGQPRPRTR